MLLFPNPASETVELRFSNPVEGALRLAVIDVTGKQVKTNRLIAAEGTTSVRLTLDGLASGVNFVRVEQQGLQAVRRLVLR